MDLIDLARFFEQAIAAEDKQEPAWWYLSFTDEQKFLGGMFIKDKGLVHATAQAYRLGINPGGQVKGCQLDAYDEEQMPAKKYLNRLLSVADMEEAGLNPVRIDGTKAK